MPLWNSSKKEPETVTMEKASGSKPLCPEVAGETRDIRRAYEFKEVLGTYVPVELVVIQFVFIYFCCRR